MKKEVDSVIAMPSKRMFTSIISDYDLNRSICELIDNSLDTWLRGKKVGLLTIDIEIDENQQSIKVTDNAGGVAKSDLNLIVGPGHTGNSPDDDTIGFFGVGTKRAVVALAQNISITTRYGHDKTYHLEFGDTWIKDESWEMPVYMVDDTPKGTTIIELNKLRNKVTEEEILKLKEHLQVTYAFFLDDESLSIRFQNEELKPVFFEKWSYPGEYSPHEYIGTLPTEDGGEICVSVTAGLSNESSPAAGEYGVYFYCNDRLVARALKTFDVGFVAGLAGQPHPSISLTRVIVRLNGKAKYMPWNSSKSDINPNNNVFKALRGWLVIVIKDYASLSRRWAGKWPDMIFKHKKGEIIKVQVDNFPEAKKSYLPELPKTRKKYDEEIKKVNKKVSDEKPWTKGLYEAIIAVDVFYKLRLEQKNRICLIILDSTLEIAFKEFLVNECATPYSEARLASIFANRSQVHDEVKKQISFDDPTWKKIEFYYRLRCELVHKRVTTSVSDQYIADYRKVIHRVLKKMFKLKFDIDQAV